MPKDLDSAGVYFMSVADFHWRPGRDDPDQPADEKKRADEAGSREKPVDEERKREDPEKSR